MTEDEMKIIASQFFRSLLRGEAPSGPQGKLPPSVRWLDPDPEWQRKFQEAYRAAEQSPIPDPVNPYKPFRGEETPEAAAQSLKESEQRYGRNLNPEAFGELHGSPNRPELDQMWEAAKRQQQHEPPYSRIDVSEHGNMPWPEGSDASLDAMLRQGNPAENKGPWSIMRRINPVELAKNLASRVNAGPMNPWDFFPGGLDGYLRYLAQHNAGMGAFVGSADEDWSGEF